MSGPTERAPAPRRITLLTDFGTTDGYAAAMRGVIAELAPFALVDDVSHDLRPGDVAAAAWTLARYWDVYPEGTIHVVVVDPGVGTRRHALALVASGRTIVAPDNGCATLVLERVPDAVAVSIENPAYQRHPVSSTFHGRDIFAPAAAHLANGLPAAAFGPVIPRPVRLEMPRPQRAGGRVEGVVVHVDRFGNLITNLPGEWAPGLEQLELGGRELGPVRSTYGAVASGEFVVVVGSAGLIEISVRDGDAAAVLGVDRGARVVGRLRQ